MSDLSPQVDHLLGDCRQSQDGDLIASDSSFVLCLIYSQPSKEKEQKQICNYPVRLKAFP